jgi:superfamily II DNA or RNA helicase
MGILIGLEQVDNFRPGLQFPPTEISPAVVNTVRSLDEREEIEPFLRSILTDVGETPHGPAEIADILTHKVAVRRKVGIAAFIIKGKAFPTVRPKHVSHQIYNIEKIADLSVAFLVTTGIVLDKAKEQFISVASRVAQYYCVLDALDIGRLFVGFGFICPRDGSRIVGGRCACGYSPAKRLLNVLQEQTLKDLAQAHSLGQAAGLVILPPGSGKTRIAAEDARTSGAKRVLYVAHTQEILDVAESEFVSVYGRNAVTRHETTFNSTNLNSVNIATVQLLSHRLNDLEQHDFDYLVVDEFHHAAARTYRALIETVRPAFLLGLTATPFRSDRKDIVQLCGNNIIANFELRAGIEFGVLTPYHYYGCFDDVDYSNIRHNGFQYNIRDLERALIIPERDRAIISKWMELVEGKPTVAFCCSKRHAKRVAETFRKQGVTAEEYTSDTDYVRRRELQQDFQDGKLTILCAVDILNEGADFPFVEGLLFLRPTESARIFIQQMGRGLRKYVGKSHCTVIDFIGNFKNAFKIVEYQGLLPDSSPDSVIGSRTLNPKALLNLPPGCRVEFDDRVIDVFARQSLDPRFATRHNIGRILVYEYQRLWRRLGYKPKAKDVNRLSRLNTDIYATMFGSWRTFDALADDLSPSFNSLGQ